MPKIYTHKPNKIRPNRQSVDEALENPESEVYSYSEESQRPTRLKVEDIGNSENFIYLYPNGRPSRVKGRDSGVVPPVFPMILRINTNFVSGTTFSIPISGAQIEQTSIDWGDGTTESFIGSIGSLSHTYDTEGEYTVQLNIKGPINMASPFSNMLVSIDDWGDIEAVAINNLFRNTTNMTFLAELPNTVVFADNMFRESNVVDVSHWVNIPENIDISSMFNDSSFNQDIGGWNLPPNISGLGGNDTFGETWSSENYSRTLIGWANNIFDRGGIVINKALNVPNLQYIPDEFLDITGEFNNAVDARNYLVNTLGWTITDDGAVPPPPLATFQDEIAFQADTTLTIENTISGIDTVILNEIVEFGSVGPFIFGIRHAEPGGGFITPHQNQNGVWIQFQS